MRYIITVGSLIATLVFLLLGFMIYDRSCCTNYPRGTHAIERVNEANRLRIVDINIWSGLDYKGKLMMGEYESAQVRELRYQSLLSQLQELKADVIGIHEANLLPQYARRIALNLDYDVYYHVGVGGVRAGPIGLPWNMREGDAILARKSLAMEPVGRKQLSGGLVTNFFTFHLDDATQVVGVKLHHQDKELFVFATHWHASLLMDPKIKATLMDLRKTNAITEAQADEFISAANAGSSWRISESAKTLQFVRENVGESGFILMGDFNSTADMPEINMLKEDGMLDSYSILNPDSNGYSWDPYLNLNIQLHYTKTDALHAHQAMNAVYKMEQQARRRIDYIFIGNSVENGISPIASSVVLQQAIEGVHPSDHFGIYTEIEL